MCRACTYSFFYLHGKLTVDFSFLHCNTCDSHLCVLVPGQHYSEEFGKISMIRKVPVMKDGSFILTERYDDVLGFGLSSLHLQKLKIIFSWSILLAVFQSREHLINTFVHITLATELFVEFFESCYHNLKDQPKGRPLPLHPVLYLQYLTFKKLNSNVFFTGCPTVWDIYKLCWYIKLCSL